MDATVVRGALEELRASAGVGLSTGDGSARSMTEVEGLERRAEELIGLSHGILVAIDAYLRATQVRTAQAMKIGMIVGTLLTAGAGLVASGGLSALAAGGAAKVVPRLLFAGVEGFGTVGVTLPAQARIHTATRRLGDEALSGAMQGGADGTGEVEARNRSLDALAQETEQAIADDVEFVEGVGGTIETVAGLGATATSLGRGVVRRLATRGNVVPKGHLTDQTRFVKRADGKIVPWSGPADGPKPRPVTNSANKGKLVEQQLEKRLRTDGVVSRRQPGLKSGGVAAKADVVHRQSGKLTLEDAKFPQRGRSPTVQKNQRSVYPAALRGEATFNVDDEFLELARGKPVPSDALKFRVGRVDSRGNIRVSQYHTKLDGAGKVVTGRATGQRFYLHYGADGWEQHVVSPVMDDWIGIPKPNLAGLGATR